jgi:hypothetical protein
MKIQSKIEILLDSKNICNDEIVSKLRNKHGNANLFAEPKVSRSLMKSYGAQFSFNLIHGDTNFEINTLNTTNKLHRTSA